MACEHDNAIKIFRGDDTNWNDEVLLSFQVTSETVDLSTMTAEFILGGIKKTNISLADSGEFEISLSHAETSTLPWGLNNGILKIYDADKRIKTVANNIPFWVTDDPVGMQSGTIVIPVPEASAVSIVLQVGIKYVTEAELQDVQADLQAQIDGKQPAGNYATVAQLNTGLAGKQDTISDLATIRNGATLGTTAVQPADLNTALDTKQDKLTQTQLDAVNSGADATKIAQIATNQTAISGLQSSKLDVSTAASTYLAKTDAESTYLTQANAASTYATQTALSTGLAGKQDTLSTAQLAAVNSGVTTSTVSQVATNLSYLTGFAPYIQKYEVGNFLTQQTVDATDLLSATGALHALDLDLSTNTQLKKLTAKGTSGNLANVSRVLVSNEAPFDNATSPQLDVSYTGLNKAALVNLFNSMPYNVGYTVVGSPTITDGVVSGFNSSPEAYLMFTTFAPGTHDFEIKTAFTANALQTMRLFATQGSGSKVTGLTLSNNGSIMARFYDGENQTDVTSSVSYTANQKYYVIMYRSGTTVGIKVSTDDENYTENTNTISADTSIVIDNSVFAMGINRWGGAAFDGSMDMNYSYIKMNDKPWGVFDGITRTCSVVGCTGTADLTQDDKNIALNKGWALTVA